MVFSVFKRIRNLESGLEFANDAYRLRLIHELDSYKPNSSNYNFFILKHPDKDLFGYSVLTYKINKKSKKIRGIKYLHLKYKNGVLSE